MGEEEMGLGKGCDWRRQYSLKRRWARRKTFPPPPSCQGSKELDRRVEAALVLPYTRMSVS